MIGTRSLAKVLALLLVVSLLAGCSLWRTASPEERGGAVGGAAGAVTGALIAGWRGGIIGGVLGVVAGATIAHIADRASREAAHHQRPVSYTSDSGDHRVEAYPVGRRGNCRTVQEKYFEHGRLVRETRQEICD